MTYPTVNFTDVDSMLEASISDFINEAKKTSEAYIALISFDFKKRKTNRSNQTHMFVISGDNFDSAIANFKETDESSGINEDDYSLGNILTVHLQSVC